MTAKYVMDHGRTVVGDVAWHWVHEGMVGSVGDDRRLVIWDCRAPGKPAQVVTAHAAEANCVAFNPCSDHLIATGSSDTTVAIWDMRNLGQKLHSLESHTDGVLQVQWSPHYEKVLLSGSMDKRVNVWDLERVGCVQTEEEQADGPPELLFVHGGHVGRIEDAAWNQNDPLVVCSAAEDNTVHVWQMTSSVYEENDESDD